jgi:hypothetical protein
LEFSRVGAITALPAARWGSVAGALCAAAGSSFAGASAGVSAHAEADNIITATITAHCFIARSFGHQ